MQKGRKGIRYHLSIIGLHQFYLTIGLKKLFCQKFIMLYHVYFAQYPKNHSPSSEREFERNSRIALNPRKYLDLPAPCEWRTWRHAVVPRMSWGSSSGHPLGCRWCTWVRLSGRTWRWPCTDS